MPLLSGTPTWQKWATLLVLIILVGLNVAIIIVGSNNTTVLHKQEASQERIDCARVINTAQTKVRDEMITSKAEMDKEFVLATVQVSQGIQTRDDAQAMLTNLANDLDTKIVAVKKLPDAAKLVERTCPS